MSKFIPTPSELKPRASLFWPDDLRAKQEAISIIPKLIKTQDKFISILDVSDGSPDAWKNVLAQMKDFPPNLFLKHLTVLADVGGELLKRISPELSKIFSDKQMIFVWKRKSHSYQFKGILSGGISNKHLFIDGESLAQTRALDAKMEDVIMLLLFGSAVTNAKLPPLIGEKCTIGTLIGESEELQRFVKQRHIFVSRITAGATSNALGQIAQGFVRDYLKSALPSWKITRNGQIRGISQNNGKRIETPSLRWIKKTLRNNLGFRLKEKVLHAFVVGSVAKGKSNSQSDLDVAVVIPKKRRASSLNLTERFHFRMAQTQSLIPTFNGRKVDFQFFYPDDLELAGYSRLELK